MELLLLSTEAPLDPQDEHLRPYRLRAGDVIDAREDGHPWSIAERTHPEWRIIRSPIVRSEAIMLTTGLLGKVGKLPKQRQREWMLDATQLPNPKTYSGKRTQEIIEVPVGQVRKAMRKKGQFSEQTRIPVSGTVPLAMMGALPARKVTRRRLLQFISGTLAFLLLRREANAATVTKTIGTTARDYSTIAAWVAALPANLVTNGNIQVGQCFNDSEFTITSGISISGHTTDSTHYINLTCGAGASFQNPSVRSNLLAYNASNGVGVRKTTSYGVVITLSDNYTRMSLLQIKGDGTNPSPINATGTNLLLQDLIVDTAGGSGESILISGSSNMGVNISLFTRGSAGDGIYGTSGTTLIGCQVVRTTDQSAAGIGFKCLYGTNILVSCATFGFSTAASAAFDSSSKNNGTDKSSGISGSNNQFSITFSATTPFTQAAVSGYDLRAKAATTLAAHGFLDAVNAPNDISGTVRANPPTIGAWEIVTASGRPPGQFPRVA